MLLKNALILLFLFFQRLIIFGTELPDSSHYPLHYFRNPLDLPAKLNADFGEFRSNHFHSGIDLNTLQKTGFPVYAAADGYVSRIKVQRGGYGQALYITHPNGFVSVYGHLDAYYDSIARYLKRIQYQAHTYELDIYPKFNELPVKKGEQVAWSGNTGFSGGPHLHFEVRDAKTEEIINPLLFGFPVSDTKFPIIKGIYLFELISVGKLTRIEPIRFIPAVFIKTGKYKLAGNNELNAVGKIVLGIIATDSQNGSDNQNGVFSISLSNSNQEVFYSQFERFGFDQTRSINSYLDYFLLHHEKLNVQRSYVEPGNRSTLYKDITNSGVIDVQPGFKYLMEYEVGDVMGNKSQLDFTLKCSRKDSINRTELDKTWAASINNEYQNPAGGIFPLISFEKDTSIYFDTYGKAVKDKNAEFVIQIPANALFDNQILKFKTAPTHLGMSPFDLGSVDIPIKDSILVGVKLPTELSYPVDKYIMLRNNSYQNGVVKDGRLWSWIKDFGEFHIVPDVNAPWIMLHSKIPNHEHTGSKIQFQIKDDYSGIKQYNGEIDGNWELFTFDAKTHLLSYIFEKEPKIGHHKIVIHVSDKVGNESKFIQYFNQKWEN